MQIFNRYSGFISMLPLKWAGDLRPTMDVLYQLSYIGILIYYTAVLPSDTYQDSYISMVKIILHFFYFFNHATNNVA